MYALLIALFLIGQSSCVWGRTDPVDPYSVLGVSRDASQAQIKKRYRELCLQYHPDKNVDKSELEQKRCENMFKTIQKANSLIGDEESRRIYDLQQSSPFSYHQQHHQYTSQGQSSSAFSQTPFSSGDPFTEAFFRTFAKPSSFSSSGPRFYFYSNSGSPFFQARPTSAASSFSDMFQQLRPGVTFKSIYVQKVKIPLEDLYKGKTVQIRLHDNIWLRYRAAFRGKVGYLVLYQALLFAMPLLRWSRTMAILVAWCVFHSNVPQATQTTYDVPIPAGSKGQKTKVTFQSQSFTQPEIVFELEEEQHPLYRRIGIDLHTQITITPKQAKRGCTIQIPSLDGGTDHPIPITLRPNQIMTSGEHVCIPGQGWPIRNGKSKHGPDRSNNTYHDNHDDNNSNHRGDLIVQVLIQKKKKSFSNFKKQHHDKRKGKNL